MDTQQTSKPEAADKTPDALPASEVELLTAQAAQEVSSTHFEDLVREAIQGVGGTLLLTLPAHGGQLKVETTTQSADPLAAIAESYAGLMDILKVAA